MLVFRSARRLAPRGALPAFFELLFKVFANVLLIVFKVFCMVVVVVVVLVVVVVVVVVFVVVAVGIDEKYRTL